MTLLEGNPKTRSIQDVLVSKAGRKVSGGVWGMEGCRVLQGSLKICSIQDMLVRQELRRLQGWKSYAAQGGRDQVERGSTGVTSLLPISLPATQTRSLHRCTALPASPPQVLPGDQVYPTDLIDLVNQECCRGNSALLCACSTYSYVALLPRPHPPPQPQVLPHQLISAAQFEVAQSQQCTHCCLQHNLIRCTAHRPHPTPPFQGAAQ